MKSTLVVRQRQYAFVTSGFGRKRLVTRNIFVCTVLFGVDRSSGVAFLAHFDLPWSTNALSDILNEAKSKAGPDANFELEIINGSFWFSALCVFSSFLTRLFLRKGIAKFDHVTVKRDHKFTYTRLKRAVEYKVEDMSMAVSGSFLSCGKDDGAITTKMARHPDSA
jgi:hypothetical protein